MNKKEDLSKLIQEISNVGASNKTRQPKKEISLRELSTHWLDQLLKDIPLKRETL
jgi:hypothetical protein